MEYRKEIDGLRALAVLPVIFFHTGLSTFSGGYVGVDIFFVISGYLITSLILNEQKTGAFSIVDFYERRARRILPALTVVLFFATLAAYSILDPWLLKQFSQSLVSVASFSSNVFFYLKSGYFSAASDEIPLIHTWSLAVEEQFYLIFPILIILLWPYGRRRLVGSLVFVAFFSLALADYLSDKSIDANFYLIMVLPRAAALQLSTKPQCSEDGEFMLYEPSRPGSPWLPSGYHLDMFLLGVVDLRSSYFGR